MHPHTAAGGAEGLSQRSEHSHQRRRAARVSAARQTDGVPRDITGNAPQSCEFVLLGGVSGRPSGDLDHASWRIRWLSERRTAVTNEPQAANHPAERKPQPSGTGRRLTVDPSGSLATSLILKLEARDDLSDEERRVVSAIIEE